MEYGIAMTLVVIVLAYVTWRLNHAVRFELDSKQWQTYCELKRMSDRELSDIGLTRDDIYNVAKGIKK